MTPLKLKVNRDNGKHNLISLPARFGSIETNCFIYADSMRKIKVRARAFAMGIADVLSDKPGTAAYLEIGFLAAFLKAYGYIHRMEMSKSFTVFYNIALCALEMDAEQIEFDSADEFIIAA